jgi:exo-beta-1,3-glucanase (GH17 family)
MMPGHNFLSLFLAASLALFLYSCETRHPPRTSGEKAPTVEVRKTGKGFQLFRNGEPYLIKGACSQSTELSSLRKAGGNSFRTYDTAGLDALLSLADSFGLTVMAGIWVGRDKEGFDYKDKTAVRKQKEEVRALVNRYKDHPALLCWAVGNEPDNDAKDTHYLWPALDEIAVMIHEMDPNHPVTIPVYANSVEAVVKNCPNLDFISINIFGELDGFPQNFKQEIPIVYTEWGTVGNWESKTTMWQASMEESIKQKYERIYNTYHRSILGDSSRCMGSYVFYWGNKQEGTTTWFNFFSEDGRKTALVDLMAQLWGGQPPENLAPFLDSMNINGKGQYNDILLDADEIAHASVYGVDPELGALNYHWEIVPDGPFFDYPPGKGRVEIRPNPIPGLILENKSDKISFRTPLHTGAFRLFVFTLDDHGYASYANLPFFVSNNKLTN